MQQYTSILTRSSKISSNIIAGVTLYYSIFAFSGLVSITLPTTLPILILKLLSHFVVVSIKFCVFVLFWKMWISLKWKLASCCVVWKNIFNIPIPNVLWETQVWIFVIPLRFRYLHVYSSKTSVKILSSLFHSLLVLSPFPDFHGHFFSAPF